MDEKRTDNCRDSPFSEHEKQFAYLPLAVLLAATNIRQLFGDIESGKRLDALIRKIHSQMPSKIWAPEMLNLRFIDTTTNECNAIEQDENEATATIVEPKRRKTRSASVKENNPNVEQVTRQMRKRKVKSINA